MYVFIRTIDILPKTKHPVGMFPKPKPKPKHLSMCGEIFSLGSMSTEISSSGKTSKCEMKCDMKCGMKCDMKCDITVSPENATPLKLHQIEKLRLVDISQHK